MEKHRQEAVSLLGRETSPAKRRALIEELSIVFREAPTGGQRELHQVGEALARLLPGFPAPERALVAERIANAKYAPTYLVHLLAMDEPEVAAPVLALSPVLAEGDLTTCAAKGGTARLAAIARRPSLPKLLQAAILDSGDTKAIAALIGNRATALSVHALNAALAQAHNDASIAGALVVRPDIPLAPLAELYFTLGPDPRRKFLRALTERSDAAAPTAALDDTEARFLQAVRSGDRAQMLAALRRGFHVAPAVAECVLSDESCEALAVVAIGSGLSRAAYSTFVVLSHAPDGMSAALELYAQIPRTGARRLLALWQTDGAKQPASSGRIARPEPPAQPAAVAPAPKPGMLKGAGPRKR